MNNKQTRCPNCQRLYKVTVPQLTVAQGMVCCPKCLHRFNAILHLRVQEQPTPRLVDTPAVAEPRIFFNRFKTLPVGTPPPGLEILTRCIENSNLDLRNYLNNLNYFHHDAVHFFPSVNLSKTREMANNRKKRPRVTYYLMWGAINLSLLLLFAFQFLWFNPKFLERSEILNHFFTHSCNWLHCETLDQRYLKIKVEHLQVERSLKNHIQISGVLMNYQKESLKLPKLKVTIENGQESHVQIISPAEYLIHSLNGIKRIPAEQPVAFQFILKRPYEPNWQYKIQIIRP